MSLLIKSINGSGIEQFLYNPISFTIGSIIFALGIFLSFHIIKRKKINVDREFVYSLTPFIMAGVVLEPLYTFLHSIIVILTSFTAYIGALTYSRDIKEYSLQISATGFLVLTAVIGLYQLENLDVVKYSFLTSLVWGIPAIALGIKELVPEKVLIPVTTHFLDASTTFSVIRLGGAERHFYAGKFIEIFGSAGIFIFKALVIIPVTFYIYRNFKKNERNYYLYVIAVIGLGLALRNILEAV